MPLNNGSNVVHDVEPIILMKPTRSGKKICYKSVKSDLTKTKFYMSKKPQNTREVRMEEGYFISNSDLKGFLKKLSAIAVEKKFKTPYNQTIYLNNDDHEVPFNFSVRARKYDDRTTGRKFFPNTSGEWRFEIKQSMYNMSRWREKIVLVSRLDNILKKLKNKTLSMPFPVSAYLSPHVAATYRRIHYHLRENDKFRITIDTNLKYYIFRNPKEAIKRGSEDISRIELKFPKNLLDSPIHKQIRGEISKLKGSRPLSKKQVAYNIQYKYLKKKYKKWPVNPDTEIEAKMLLDADKQNIFHELKNDFRGNKVKGFSLVKNHEYGWEYHTLARYIITEDGRHIRLNNDMKTKHVVYKSKQVVMNDPFGLGCILKRREIKKKNVPDNLLNKPFLLSRRSRKTFIVQNTKTKSVYIILTDRSSVDGDRKDLYQMEIEKVCSRPSLSEQKAYVEDIANITNYVIKKYKHIKPTTLTKQEWVNFKRKLP